MAKQKVKQKMGAFLSCLNNLAYSSACDDMFDSDEYDLMRALLEAWQAFAATRCRRGARAHVPVKTLTMLLATQLEHDSEFMKAFHEFNAAVPKHRRYACVLHYVGLHIYALLGSGNSPQGLDLSVGFNTVGPTNNHARRHAFTPDLFVDERIVLGLGLAPDDA